MPTPTKSTRTAVVTGAACGIGAAIATELARNGVCVHCLDILEEPLHQTATAICSEGGMATGHLVDLSDQRAILDVCEMLGKASPTIDILVNNAAQADETPLEDLSLSAFRKVLAVNVEAILSLVQALLPALRRSETGRILNIASIQGLRSTYNSTAYGTSKGAVVNLTRSLACDLAPHGILVNALAPGFIDTPMAALPDGLGTEYDTDWFRNIYAAAPDCRKK